MIALITGVFSRIPSKLIIGALLVASGFYLGHRWVSSDFDAYKREQALQVAELELKASAVTTLVVTEYVDRVQVVKEVGATVIKKVPVYVPRNVCSLPADFRRLHHHAVRGEALPEPTGNTNEGSRSP